MSSARRSAAVLAEERTKLELSAGLGDDPDYDEAGDASFVVPAAKRAAPAAAAAARTNIGISGRGRGGIMLDEEDEAELGPAVSCIVKASAPVEEPSETATRSRVDDLWDDLQRSAGNKAKRAAGAGSSGAGGSKKRRKKRQNGAKIDPALAAILAGSGSGGVAKGTAAAAAKAALAATGRLRVTETVKFAGETMSVSRVVDKGSSEAAASKARQRNETNLDRLVSGLKSKKGITAVEKSSYDWDNFKEAKGLQEELKNATADGYVEKQDFLNRVDLRRFEIEKQDRERRRALAASQAGTKK